MRIRLIIVLTVILIQSFIPFVLARIEFVDDYQNENYIAIKEKMIRNSELNAMELDYSMKGDKKQYEKKGYFQTIMILSGVNVSSLTLLINSTLERGSIKVQFSKDNSTWVNHKNQEGYDSLIEGSVFIDLMDLNFNTLYMKFNFNRGGKNKTPRLYQIRLISIEGDEGGAPPDDYSVIFLAIGIILMLLVAFLYNNPR